MKQTHSNSKNRGTLIIIGGSEDKTDEMEILKEVAQHTHKNKMVVVTIASNHPEELWADYRKIFNRLGVKNISHFSIEEHQEARDPENIKIFDDAHTVFFSGGDQLKVTSKIGGTPVIEKIKDIYRKGGLIAGTSAGAAIMGKMMLVGNPREEIHKVGDWHMAPGLGFVEDMIVDQHFAQRGRIGRLLGAVAQNPGILGIGIDEDTAIVVKDDSFKVIGANAAYVIDGRFVSNTNVSEATANETMSVHGLQLHILANKETFTLSTREIQNVRRT